VITLAYVWFRTAGGCSGATHLSDILPFLKFVRFQRPPRGPGGLAIRGVGGAPLPTTRGVGGPSARPRRDALSKGSDAPSNHRSLTSSAAGRVMPIDSLREFVKKRYNPELRFLNFEVRHVHHLLRSALIDISVFSTNLEYGR
jgi:hypothetical protein